MSLDRSLKAKGTMGGIRSVFKRSERIAKLTTDKKFDAAKGKVLGLQKVGTGKR